MTLVTAACTDATTSRGGSIPTSTGPAASTTTEMTTTETTTPETSTPAPTTIATTTPETTAIEATTIPPTAPEASAAEPDPVAPTTTDAPPAPDPMPQPDPASDAITDLPAPIECGDFGPIPPRPDSMPTVLVDTDGDGSSDDEVTAYGAPAGWTVRVVENGAVSEAVVASIAGFARLDGLADGGAHPEILLLDVDTGVVHTLSTAGGCVALTS
jgi:hypothetical protein